MRGAYRVIDNSKPFYVNDFFSEYLKWSFEISIALKYIVIQGILKLTCSEKIFLENCIVFTFVSRHWIFDVFFKIGIDKNDQCFKI